MLTGTGACGVHPLDTLRQAEGRWQATYQLRLPDGGDDSPSRAVITPLLGGRFVRIDYDWSFKGDPQEGKMLIGFEADRELLTTVWIDTWHNADRIMISTGKPGNAGPIDVRGSYAAPPGPDWGWRTTIAAGADRVVMEMFNVTPEGEEMLAVRADYRRA